MARYSDTLRDDLTQAPVEGALVSVVVNGTGGTASLTDDDGHALDNPFLTDEFGSVVFHAPPSYYDLEYHYGGRMARKDYNVAVFDGGSGPSDTLIGFDDNGDLIFIPVDDFQGAPGVPSGNAAAVPTRVVLAAIVAPTLGQVAYLSEAGREGWFRFSTANNSANVTADTLQGLYVAPAAAPTGASGAWVRIYDAGIIWANWFGTHGDGVTSDQSILQTVINFAVARGIVVIKIPSGIFLVTNLTLPGVSQPAPGVPITQLRIEGTNPNMFTGNNGTIIKSLATTGTALLRQLPGGDFAGLRLTLRDLEFRLYDNPQITAIDCSFSNQLVIDNVNINTGVYPSLVSQPTTTTSRALIMPNVGNNAWSYIKGLLIYGFYIGLECNEHTNADQLIIGECYWAIYIRTSIHPLMFGHVSIEWCKRVITLETFANFSVECLNIEHQTSGWWMTDYDIYDVGNSGVGEVKWSVVKAGVGQDTTFTRNGGANIITRRIGTTPRPETSVHSQAATQTTTSGVALGILWASGVSTQASHIGSPASSIVIDVAGFYEVDVTATFASNAAGIRQLVLYKNGTRAAPSIVYPAVAGGVTDFQARIGGINFAVGDILEVQALQTSGAALDLTPTGYSGYVYLKRLRDAVP